MVQQAEETGLSAWLRRAPDAAALVILALIGLAISIYLTTVHYAGVPLACPSGGIVNCAAVTTSSYSVVPGTQAPITIPGMLWFLISGGLALLSGRAQLRTGAIPASISLVHFIWGAIGLAAVLYLVYVELARLHKICEWCSAVHVLTLLSFLLALSRLQRSGDA